MKAGPPGSPRGKPGQCPTSDLDSSATPAFKRSLLFSLKL